MQPNDKFVASNDISQVMSSEDKTLVNQSNITDAEPKLYDDRAPVMPPFISKLRRKTPVKEQVVIQTEGIVNNELNADNRALTMSRKSGTKSGTKSGSLSRNSHDDLIPKSPMKLVEDKVMDPMPKE